MAMKNLKIEYININQLKPAEYNPRKASKKQVEDVKKSRNTPTYAGKTG